MRNSPIVRFVKSVVLCVFILAAGMMLYKLDPHNQLEFNFKLLLKLPLMAIGTAAAVILFWVIAQPTTDTTPAE